MSFWNKIGVVVFQVVVVLGIIFLSCCRGREGAVINHPISPPGSYNPIPGTR
jgi:uncharacterized membrane protein